MGKLGVGVGVMILRDDKVLLGKRNDDPQKADSELHGEGTWTMPGGRLEFKEGLKGCGAREVKEETGICVKSLKLISVSNDFVGDVHFVTIGFLCKNFEGEPRVMEPDEITEWRWYPINNLPEPIFFPSKRILDNYLNNRIFLEEQ